ncbi:cell division protein ZapA [Levilactobacillus fujinensis]|uniref:Cell division protein ZapA n=1 Tax=Levilactobacillus fujinensis TaxID=2486024 RepID=A0ABW1TEQ5_9LACO|nr:cell division protein ZapA [Levilactobacillus fujinensis]
MTEETHRFKAMIAGKSYTIVGQATDEHMRAVTDVLNEQLTQLKQLAPNMSKEDAAILMAFNAVSDQLKLAAASDQSTTTGDKATAETKTED